MGQSLYKACKYIILTRESGTTSVGDYDVAFELYDQKDIDNNVAAIAAGKATGCTFGDSDVNKVVLVAEHTITIPAGFTLIPRYAKKSLVIMCNTLIINGTISMQAKGPNILPHEWFILANDDLVLDTISDIVIPAYANNQTATYLSSSRIANGIKGKDGTNRQCGAGGMGGCLGYYSGGKARYHRNGSGTAFAGGAGSGSNYFNGWSNSNCPYYATSEVDTIYPMRAGRSNDIDLNAREATGGVGNPRGTSMYKRHIDGSTYRATDRNDQNTGVGGRIIIFCGEFINNGTITANGTNGIATAASSIVVFGGASGGGAVDLFYNTFANAAGDMGTVTANGGMTGSSSSVQSGGNGSVTPFQWSVKNIVKEKTPFMTKPNMLYFAQGFVDRFNGAR